MSTNAEMLEQVRLAISSTLAGSGVQEYTIAGKSIKRYSLKELMDLETYYSTKVASEGGLGKTYANFLDV